LLGPVDFAGFEDEFADDYDPKKRPDLQKELGNFAKNPFNPSEPLSVETLVKFINYDDHNVASIGEDVTVLKGD